MTQENPKDLTGPCTLNSEELNARFIKWAETVSKNTIVDYDISMDVLKTYFKSICEVLKDKKG